MLALQGVNNEGIMMFLADVSGTSPYLILESGIKRFDKSYINLNSTVNKDDILVVTFSHLHTNSSK